MITSVTVASVKYAYFDFGFSFLIWNGFDQRLLLALTMSPGGHHSRIHAYRTAKKAVIGAQAQGPSPAWKGGDRNGSGTPHTPREPGSKILISRLPPDVTLQEVSVGYKRPADSLGLTYLQPEGSIQQDRRAHERGRVVLQRQGIAKGNGLGWFSERYGRGFGS